MTSEKLELLLNAALEATPEEREKSEILNVGFDPQERTWEVIVKYHGDLLFLEELSIGVELLLAGYAILTVPEGRMALLADVEEIEYVEKPKRLYFQVYAGKQASCILPVTIRPPYLSGRGVLVGIADSGIDYRHPDFWNGDGSTKIAAIWDQSLSGDVEKGWRPPEGFLTGVEFTSDQIGRALAEESGGIERARAAGNADDRSTAGGGSVVGNADDRGTAGGGSTTGSGEDLPVRDVSGHGTAVAGIAAGREGVAPESELLIVKLGTPAADSFPRTTELMRAVTYLVKKAVQMQKPIAINISFGNTYGSHDGTSLLERFLNNASEVGRCVICVGSGNEGAAMGHVAGNAKQETRVELAVGNYERTFSVQFWKNYVDTFRVTLISPGGRPALFSTDETGGERMRRILMEGTEVLLYIGEPTPYSPKQEIYMDFLPGEQYVNSGIWTFVLEPVRVVTGNYSMYLPSQTAIGENTRFYRATPDTTLTIPSTASGVITVGAYHAVNDAYADFSGRGYLFAADAEQRLGIAQNKPDLVAPGVGIVSAMAGGGHAPVTGTSFATPFVTGAAALMMEWGIVMGNDAYLYGEKVKAYLQKGARELPGFAGFPNEMVGENGNIVSEQRKA